MKDEITVRSQRNLDRVHALVNTYDSIRGTGQGRRNVQKADILRAAVVFLHATLEDFLRSLEQWKLPLAGEDALNGVAIAGQQGRPERFLLGKLTGFRGKSVDEVITLSVSEHLSRSNYSDANEVASTLKRIGFNAQLVNRHFSELEALMKRRHNIVHRADENIATGSGHFRALTISMATVNRWTDVVAAFVWDVLSHL